VSWGKGPENKGKGKKRTLGQGYLLEKRVSRRRFSSTRKKSSEGGKESPGPIGRMFPKRFTRETRIKKGPGEEPAQLEGSLTKSVSWPGKGDTGVYEPTAEFPNKGMVLSKEKKTNHKKKTGPLLRGSHQRRGVLHTKKPRCFWGGALLPKDAKRKGELFSKVLLQGRKVEKKKEHCTKSLLKTFYFGERGVPRKPVYREKNNGPGEEKDPGSTLMWARRLLMTGGKKKK